MKIKARITEVSVPTNDNFICKIAHKVEYRAIDYDGKTSRWLFHSIHADRDLAEYVKAGIEDQSIPVIFERPR
jgi:hypothetical protein